MKKLCFFIAAIMALHGCEKPEEEIVLNPASLETRTAAGMTAYYWCDGEPSAFFIADVPPRI